MKHSLGYHSDESSEELYDHCGQVIVSASLGAPRDFTIQWVNKKSRVAEDKPPVPIAAGPPQLPVFAWRMQHSDVLVMCGGMQHGRSASGWKHAVPPLRAELLPKVNFNDPRQLRFNLTFRRLLTKK